jgi:hypothetical protein
LIVLVCLSAAAIAQKAPPAKTFERFDGCVLKPDEWTDGDSFRGEIIADRLSKAGWSWGWVSTIDSEGRTIWIADAHRYGKRFIVCANKNLIAFLELETAIQGYRRLPRPVRGEPAWVWGCGHIRLSAQANIVARRPEHRCFNALEFVRLR